MSAFIDIIPLIDDYRLLDENHIKLSAWITDECSVHYRKEYPKSIYHDFLNLTRGEVTYDTFLVISKKANYAESINPSLEIEAALSRMIKEEHRPKFAAGIVVKYGDKLNSIIIGSILVTIDPRTTL